MKVRAYDTRYFGMEESRYGLYPAQHPDSRSGATSFSEDPAAVWTPSTMQSSDGQPGQNISTLFGEPDSNTLWMQRNDDDMSDVFAATDESNKKPYSMMSMKTTRADAAEKAKARQKNGSKDNSGSLTKRLVSAETPEEVRLVLSEAFQNLAELRLASMSEDPKEARAAMAGIKRLNRLIRRAQRKLSDLGKENLLRQKTRQAEKQQQEQRAEEIKQELRRRLIERKSREKGYLRDINRQTDARGQDPFGMASPALEAKIAALAEMMAQTTAAPVTGGVAAESAAFTEVSSEGGGAAECGSVAAESVGTIDVQV